ncbi:MAG TPA: FAD-linked oxidase C-terminal domain-containing protein [Pyrinomonadaceae bacterium]
MDTLIKNLGAIVGPNNVLSKPDELLVYECDGLPHHKYRPRAVVFPSSTEQTAAVMKELARAQVPFTPRGAGTGLSGGALALNEGVVVELARLRQILNIDAENRLAVVQPGVVNLHVSRAAARFGLYYVPDPSSQPTCTIGGNIAEGAGGIHCLKYGTTTDHVLGCTVVLAGGEVVELGGAGVESTGHDLLGTFIGSEGTFGIVTQATLRLVQNPPAIRTLLAEFAEVNDAGHAVSAIIAAGVMPAALEMMDHEIIRAVEASVFAAGLPPDAGAALLIELDGIEAGIDDEAARVTDICMEFGARNCRAARDETERKKLWAARKGAFGAIGRISPDSMIQDAVVPRSRLPEVLAAAYDIAKKYELKIANVFHAGDGNLHPLICFDSRFPDQVKRVKEAGRELMEVCVSAGGTITGEHGVGLDKRELFPLVFSENDMSAMLQVRSAFDPIGLCNPGKIIPMLRGCGEGRAVAELPTNGSSVSSQVFAGVQPSLPKVTHHPPFIVGRAQSNVGSIVGAEHVLSEGRNSLVAWPGSIEEVSEVVKLAAAEGWTIAPAGNMRWLKTRYKSSANLIVSTTRLNRIVEHEPADLITVAEAGVKLIDLNKTLATNGQWLPLDPPDDGSVTIGGVVAMGMGGNQQYGYGRPRGSVIGMRVVLADGSVINVGGRVVKNVAGYDLCKLFTGSRGSLGIITRLNFKLRPRPVEQQTIGTTGKLFDLIRIGQQLLADRLFPVAVEILSAKLATQLQMETPDQQPVLLIRYAGTDKGVSWQTKQTVAALSQRHLPPSLIADDVELWKSLGSFPVTKSRDFSCRVSLLPSKVAAFFESFTDADLTHAIWQLGVGDGRLRFMGHALSNSFESFSEVAHKLGGSCILEEAIDVDVNEVSKITPLMQRVKQQLDPANTFSS